MARITKKQVDERAARISARLRDGLHVERQGRNGYQALDLFDAHGCIRNLACGTMREIHNYLDAMNEALSIVNR